MLQELAALLDAVPAFGAAKEEYEKQIIENNCLDKPTMASRVEAAKRLAKEYILDFSVPAYRLFHSLWMRDAKCRALLAFQMAWLNDCVLRDSCSYFLPMPPGSEVTPEETAKWVKATCGAAYSDKTVISVARNLNSSWHQGGYIKGVRTRSRQRVAPELENTVFAIYVGLETGYAGTGLFDSPAAALLDSQPAALVPFAEQAAKQGLVKFKRIGDVIEAGFDQLGGIV